eukprot:TRINITY_DN13444_c0_g1_i1.p1 TRINITY_DN13444_c0_g1~~TRINITY_DN13444_c0_g1_i1.p1  ORF type:complete len:144 (+),score=36.93 TRINITY_DN13444_c0_g1_i1:261-692(+)
MGIGASIQESMGEVMKKNQEQMMAQQMEMQVLMQERMRRIMFTQQLAIMKERLYWMSAFGATIGTALIAGISRGVVPARNAGMLLPYSFIWAYQADMVYNNKAERINNIMVNDLFTQEDAWFTPITPNAEQIREWKKQTGMED